MADAKSLVKVELSRQRIINKVHYAAGEQEVTQEVADILKRQNSLVEKPTTRTAATKSEADKGDKT